MLAAPLIAGNDIRTMTPNIKEILMNRDVIAIDQDKDGKQAKRIAKNGDQEVWARPLAGGAHAVALFNRGAETAKVTVKWSDAGIKPKKATELWTRSAVTVTGPEYTADVPSHGVVLLRVQ
jgi:alpha-galactosidase